MKNLTFLLIIINNSIKILTIYLKKARNRNNYKIRLTSHINNINKIILKFKLIIKILK